MNDNNEYDQYCLRICADSTAQELQPVAQVVHALLGIPVTIRSRNHKGIRMERGVVLETEYTGPVLEEALQTNTVIRKVPSEGTYKGKAVVVVPIRGHVGDAIAAIGVVDLVAAMDILYMFREYPGVIEEVEEARSRMK
ncbi:DUF2111 domain-containing protein [Methanolobus chelungpuianus]|uniref:DUF2111 domain-containing protein n=1 Tax=Methanolobus chelungpuianus TaxID=502115 RepID=A0AAE3H9E0_9EURY|nr:DUF2111 domain-containing protein [Methanolobus chelungpuianus]MCQ6962381.1 hypothetical protein [Methanolobus chelungpuianus]